MRMRRCSRIYAGSPSAYRSRRAFRQQGAGVRSLLRCGPVQTESAIGNGRRGRRDTIVCRPSSTSEKFSSEYPSSSHQKCRILYCGACGESPQCNKAQLELGRASSRSLKTIENGEARGILRIFTRRRVVPRLNIRDSLFSRRLTVRTLLCTRSSLRARLHPSLMLLRGTTKSSHSREFPVAAPSRMPHSCRNTNALESPSG
jgi:hypothetical protein